MSKRALVMINSTSILEPTVIPLIEDGMFIDLISPNPQGNPGPPLFTPPSTYFAALPEGGREGQEITLRRVRNPGGMNLSPTPYIGVTLAGSMGVDQSFIFNDVSKAKFDPLYGLNPDLSQVFPSRAPALQFPTAMTPDSNGAPTAILRWMGRDWLVLAAWGEVAAMTAPVG